MLVILAHGSLCSDEPNMAKSKTKRFYCHLAVIISLPEAIIHLQTINVYYWCSEYKWYRILL